MSNWCSLPPEILENIFDHFLIVYYFEKDNIKNLAQCALTCRGWRTSAQSKFISNFKMEYDIEHLEKARQVISKNNSLGKWVKSLDLRFGGIDTYDESILLAIDTIFPLLEEVSFSNFNHNHQDLLFYSLSKIITEMRGFSRLKKISPRPRNEYQEDLYLKSLWILKHRITHLYLSERVIPRNRHEDFLDKLQYFPNIKEIEFEDSEIEFEDSEIDRRETEPQSTVEYIESLTKNNISTLLKLSIGLKISSTVSFSTTKLKTILPMYNLKRININIECNTNNGFIPNDELILYIMKKAPNLINLRILIWKERPRLEIGIFDNNSTLQSFKAITQFFNYIYKIQSCSIQNVVMASENIAKIIQSIFAGRTEPIYYNSRKNNIRFDDHEDEDIDEELENTDPLNAVINYSAYNESRTIEVIFNKYNATYRQQVLEMIEQTGNYFGTIKIRLPLTCDAFSVIKRLARCCTKVRRLEINCDFNPYEREDLLDDEEENDTTPTHNNFNNKLQKLIFSKCVPPENQFRYILDHFPNLATLVIEQQQHDVDTYFLFDIPNTSLKVKFRMKLRTGFLEDTIINSIYIKLATSDSQNIRYYFMVNQKESNFKKFKLLENPTESEFQEGIRSKDIFSLEIRCKSLQSFQIKVTSLTTHTFF